MTTEKIHQGLTALRTYEVGRLGTAIDEVLTENDLHFTGTGKTFRRNVLKGLSWMYSPSDEILQSINTNPLAAKALDFARSYFTENPEELEELFRGIERDLGTPLSKFSVTAELYDAVEKGVQHNGLFGDGSGMEVLLDTLVNHAGDIVHHVGEFHVPGRKVDVPGKASVMFTGGQSSAVAKELGISVPGIQQAYGMGGIRGTDGVLSYLVNAVVCLSADLGQELLTEVGMTKDEFVTMYHQQGIVGRGGLVDYAAGIFLGEENIGEHLYNMMIAKTLNGPKERSKKELMAEHQLSIGMITLNYSKQERIVEQELSDRYGSIRLAMVEDGVPDVLSSSALRAVYEDNGVFGTAGILSYLSKHATDVLAPLVREEVATAKDVDSLSDLLGTMARAETFSIILADISAPTPREKYAIDIVDSAEASGITPLQFLRDPAHAAGYFAVRERHQGPMLSQLSKGQRSLTDSMHWIDERLHDVRGITYRELMTEIQQSRPSGFPGAVIDAVVGKYVKKTIVQRVEDYMVLTKALLAKEAEHMGTQIELYRSISS